MPSYTFYDSFRFHIHAYSATFHRPLGLPETVRAVPHVERHSNVSVRWTRAWPRFHIPYILEIA